MIFNNNIFTRRYYDPETELYDFRTRTYHPELGRFLQRDPIGYVDGMNLYAAYFAMWGGVDPLGYVTQEERFGSARLAARETYRNYEKRINAFNREMADCRRENAKSLKAEACCELKVVRRKKDFLTNQQQDSLRRLGASILSHANFRGTNINQVREGAPSATEDLLSEGASAFLGFATQNNLPPLVSLIGLSQSLQNSDYAGIVGGVTSAGAWGLQQLGYASGTLGRFGGPLAIAATIGGHLAAEGIYRHSENQLSDYDQMQRDRFLWDAEYHRRILNDINSEMQGLDALIRSLTHCCEKGYRI